MSASVGVTLGLFAGLSVAAPAAAAPAAALPALAIALAAAVLLWPRRPGPLVGDPSRRAPDPGSERSAGARTGRWPRRRDRGGGEQALAETVELLDLIGAGLAAGLPVARATRLALADIDGTRLGAALTRCRDPGGSPDWRALATELRVDGLALVAQAWELSHTCGVPIAQAVETAAALLRAESAARRRVAVALAGPRATARVLTALPLAGIGLAAVFGIDPVRLYAATPLSLPCLAAGLVLLGVGWMWSRRLIRAVGTAGAGAAGAAGVAAAGLAGRGSRAPGAGGAGGGAGR